MSPPSPACSRALSSTTGVSISSKPCARNVRRMTDSTCSRRALSAGRKSRIPRGGFTWLATAPVWQSRPSVPCYRGDLLGQECFDSFAMDVASLPRTRAWRAPRRHSGRSRTGCRRTCPRRVVLRRPRRSARCRET